LRKKQKRKGKALVILVSLLAIVVFLLCYFQVPNQIMKRMYPKKYQEFVSYYANEYQVEEDLVYAVIKAESNFNPEAHSHKGAKGLMQLMEDTAKDVAKKTELANSLDQITERLSEPEVNIQLGTKYLSVLLERYHHKEVALTAYNAGIGTVDNWIEKGIIKADGSDIENVPYQETNQYVRKILRDHQIYQKLYKND
jgi:soluble lytic murein transglycosylase